MTSFTNIVFYLFFIVSSIAALPFSTWGQCSGSNSLNSTNISNSLFGQYIEVNCTGDLSNFTYTINSNGGESMTGEEKNPVYQKLIIQR